MASHRGMGWRGLFTRSFAVRLGAGFALVALVGAAGTALAVNAVFAARFDRYLAQQQATQPTRSARRSALPMPGRVDGIRPRWRPWSLRWKQGRCGC
jgi:hypothetical protein